MSLKKHEPAYNKKVNDTRKQKLSAALRSKEVVVIAGTGVAVATTHKHECSTWDGLIRHGIKYCVSNIENLEDDFEDSCLKSLASNRIKRMIGAAQLVASYLKEAGKYNNWLREAVGTMEAKDTALLHAIVNLSCPILTTNYDNLFEANTSLSRFTWQDTNHVEQILKGKAPGIFHLHGHWEVADSVVFGFDSYEKIVGDAHTQAMTHAMRSLKTMVFVGCGGTFDDPHFSALRKWAKQVMPNSESSHYILACASDKDKFEGKFPPEEHLEIIWYDDHAELPDLLQSLSAESLSPETPIVPKTTPSTDDDYFIVRTGSSLEPKDLLRERAQERFGFQEQYFEREEVDDVLSELITQRKHVMLTGKPLAGKSRAILHYLQKNQPDSPVYILKKETSAIAANYRHAPVASASLVFYVVNDMDDYALLSGFKACFEAILENPKAVVLATCRRAEVAEVELGLGELYFTYFKQLDIPAVKQDLKKELQKLTAGNLNIAPDDTIGSYFFPTDLYRDYYNRLPDLEKEILRTCKCMELWKKKNKSDLQQIKEYVELRYQRFYENEKKSSPVEWKKALANLQKIGFLEQAAESIFVEPAYLDRIVATDETEYDLADEITDFYGFIITYNQLIHKLSNRYDAWALYRKLKKTKVPPDVVTFTTLINRADEFADAWDAYEEMQRNKVPPDVVTFNTLINRADGFANAWSTYEEMLWNKVTPDAVTFNTLINRADGFADAWEAYEEMQRNKMPPDVVTFTTLINRADGFADAWEAYEEMQRNKVSPNVVTFTTLINRADGFADAWEVYEEMQRNKVSPNVVTFTTLINRADGFADAWGVYEEMKRNKVSPDVVTFNTLINGAEGFADAWSAYKEMQRNKVLPNVVTFTTLINRAERFADAWGVYEEMQRNKIPPDAVTFTSLIIRSEGFADAWSAYEEMQRNKVSPDVFTFTNLIKKANDFEKGWDLLQIEMPKHKVKPDKVTILELYWLAMNEEQEERLFEEARRLGLSGLIEKHKKRLE
jgi:pentatricopeptide repeat protein